MRVLLALVFVSALVGCATQRSNLESGIALPEPAGWQRYCVEYPEREECLP